ncbi:hypothetical protein [Luethyella okanaganae]|uniref:Ribosomally synthesized peptide with SipW-like signal peptide n=1 Tax=Luethyella okanaganae TaxID=69372 RepID=A0ABW1VID4_9MICO
MRTMRSERARALLASGVLLASGALLTAAAFTDYDDVTVALDGSHNRFGIVVAGAAGTQWEPTSNSWVQGNPEAYRIALGSGSSHVLSPGGILDLRIAVKNDSPSLAGLIDLDIVDPQPRGQQSDPATGNYLELFDQLLFTVSEGGTVLLDRVPATQPLSFAWSAPLAAGDHRLLDVRIELPDSVDNRWQGASTDVQFQFEAVNS